MSATKFIAILFLSFSVALSGFPAQAMPDMAADCPMMEMQKAAEQGMGKYDCDGCDCSIQCSTSSVVMYFTSKSILPQFVRLSQGIYLTDAVLSFRFPSTQDRPPKYLS